MRSVSFFFWPKAISLWHCHSAELSAGWWHLRKPQEAGGGESCGAEDQQQPKEEVEPGPGISKWSSALQGSKRSREERAHPSLQPHGFIAPLKDFPTPFFLLIFPPTAEMQLAGDLLSWGFALPVAGWHFHAEKS